MLTLLLTALSFSFDSVTEFRFGWFYFSTLFLPIFLAYHVLHNRLLGLLSTVFFASALIASVSTHSFRVILLMMFCLYGFFYFVRRQLYVESYLSQAFWVFMMTVLQKICMTLLSFQGFLFFKTFLNIALVSILAGFISIPFYIIADRIMDFLFLRLQGRVSRFLFLGFSNSI